ncbi:hypothetical protein CDIK_4255 [Cucumispora dikerogammari]|nr:hypothetical protein CDIK_4255 [Cucumispora dikerogammari]
MLRNRGDCSLFRTNVLIHHSVRQEKTINPITDTSKREEHAYTRRVKWVDEYTTGLPPVLNSDPTTVVTCEMQNKSPFPECYDYEYDYCTTDPYLSQEDNLPCEVRAIGACAIDEVEYEYNCYRGGGEGGKKYSCDRD